MKLMVIAALTGVLAMAANPADEIAIRGVVKTMEAGWSAGDAKAFASVFAPDADYVVIDGKYIKGQMAIEKGHEAIFKSIYKDTRMALQVRSLRFLGPDVATCVVAGQMSSGSGEKRGEATMSLTLARADGAWLIVGFQNTAVQASH